MKEMGKAWIAGLLILTAGVLFLGYKEGAAMLAIAACLVAVWTILINRC